jgi:hypothetical protein
MSKITDCFIHENTTSTFALYDAYKDQPSFFATRYGSDITIGHQHVSVPFFPFSDVEINDRCVLLLLEAVRANGWKGRSAYEDAEDDFRKLDHRLFRVITSADHHLIPPGYRIACAEPEQVGRIVTAGGQTGIVLFDAQTVIGYKGRGRTAFEFVEADFLAA